MTHETNFFHEGTSEDVDLIFGPLEQSDGPFIEINMETSLMAHLLHAAGLFPSVKQAKNNGWAKPIPCGYTELIVGKAKRRVNVWFPCKGPQCDRQGCFRCTSS